MMGDLLPPGFLLVLQDAPDSIRFQELEGFLAALGAQALCIDPTTDAAGVFKIMEADKLLAGWFERHGCKVALVRPDYIVYGVAGHLS